MFFFMLIQVGNRTAFFNASFCEPGSKSRRVLLPSWLDRSQPSPNTFSELPSTRLPRADDPRIFLPRANSTMQQLRPVDGYRKPPLVRLQPCLRRLSVRHVPQWTKSAIRMTMGMGMPSIKSKIERIASLLNQFEITSGPIPLDRAPLWQTAIGLRGRANR